MANQLFLENAIQSKMSLDSKTRHAVETRNRDFDNFWSSKFSNYPFRLICQRDSLTQQFMSFEIAPDLTPLPPIRHDCLFEMKEDDIVSCQVYIVDENNQPIPLDKQLPVRCVKTRLSKELTPFFQYQIPQLLTFIQQLVKHMLPEVTGNQTRVLQLAFINQKESEVFRFSFPLTIRKNYNRLWKPGDRLRLWLQSGISQTVELHSWDHYRAEFTNEWTLIADRNGLVKVKRGDGKPYQVVDVIDKLE